MTDLTASQEDQTVGWSEDDSELYLKLAHIAVPAREIQAGIVVACVSRALELTGSAEPRIAELCCGGGDLASALLGAMPQARYVGFDGSDRMLETTAGKLAPFGDQITLKRFDLGAVDWRAGLELDACVSSLAVHHLDGPGKAALFADIRRALRPGGVFVLADLVEPVTGLGRTIAAAGWDREAARRAGELAEGAQALAAFHDEEWNYYAHGDDTGIDMPSSIADHLAYFRDAGFVDADLHFLDAGHAVFSAWAPPG